jgi:DNA-binding beta-propeller fold protein YncE
MQCSALEKVLENQESMKKSNQFMGPADLAVDSDDNIFVTDRDNDRVQVFTNNGTFITSFGSEDKPIVQVSVF